MISVVITKKPDLFLIPKSLITLTVYPFFWSYMAIYLDSCQNIDTNLSDVYGDFMNKIWIKTESTRRALKVWAGILWAKLNPSPEASLRTLEKLLAAHPLVARVIVHRFDDLDKFMEQMVNGQRKD